MPALLEVALFFRTILTLSPSLIATVWVVSSRVVSAGSLALNVIVKADATPLMYIVTTSEPVAGCPANVIISDKLLSVPPLGNFALYVPAPMLVV